MNAHGIDDSKLIISTNAERIMAKPFIDALRDFQKRAPMFAAGVDEPTLSDKFVLQMARIFRDGHFGGTLTLLPDDIMEFLHPGYMVRQKERL